MKNQYLLSVVETSKRYNIPRDKIYAAIRTGNTEIPFIKIGSITRINTIMLEKLLDEKAASHENLF